MRTLAALAAVSLYVFAAVSVSADSCSSVEKVVNRSSKLASASTWSNARGSEGSLRFESQKMLLAAADDLAKASPPENLCPASCRPAAKPEIVFTSIPNKYLSDYDEAPKCSSLLEKTKSTPFTYNGKTFPNIQEFSDWFSKFSQGSGPEGKDLYSKCDGKCSPQYTSFIAPSGTNYSVESKVVCGPARDKDDNQYTISIAFRWRCEKA